MALGLVIYFACGHRHSVLASRREDAVSGENPQ